MNLTLSPAESAKPAPDNGEAAGGSSISPKPSAPEPPGSVGPRDGAAPGVQAETLKKIELTVGKWQRDANILRVVHAVFAASATICSLLVAAKSADKDSVVYPYISWISFAAAVSIGIISAFNLGSKANRYRRAWRYMRARLFKFKEGLIPVEKLIDSYSYAEEIVGDVKEEPK